MASRGFEFCYYLDGSNATPVIRDFTCGQTAYSEGDVVTIQSDGYFDGQTTNVAEVTGIVMETVTGATAGTTKAKLAIITPFQVWRCSTDGTSCAAKTGYTKTVDVADANTIDASDITNGSMIKVDAGTDDDGNVLLYVVFTDTTFGNA